MCIFTPASIAFGDLGKEDVSSTVIHAIMDVIFAIDIFVVFFSAFYDEGFKIVDDFKEIARDYTSGWFLIDFVALIPFDIIFRGIDDEGLDSVSLVRIAKLGRISKILKLTRLIRILKILKRNNIFKAASQFFQLSNGISRIFMFVFSSILFCHIFACLWVFFSKLSPEDQDSWANDESIQEMDNAG